MGQLRPVEALIDVSLATVDDVVNTTLNPGGGTITTGIQTVSPASMKGIYPGVLLVIDYGQPNEEAVRVVSATTATFTANFLQAHLNTALVVAPTFPSGQAAGDPLFTQAEMLGYLGEAQNDFLLKVQPVYNMATQPLSVGVPIYSGPADAIRIERISILQLLATPPTSTELWNETVTGIDWMQPSSGATPKSWYQDKVGIGNFGISPTPQEGQTANVIYSQRASDSLGLLDKFLIPDVMACFLKYRVLALALSKDGETRDDQLAQHCQRMFDFVVIVSQKFIQGVNGRMRQGETVEPALATMKQGG